MSYSTHKLIAVIFFAEKLLGAFATAKAPHSFSAKMPEIVHVGCLKI